MLWTSAVRPRGMMSMKPRTEELTPIQRNFVARVARDYVRADHQPGHPSYTAFNRDTVKQFAGLVEDGWTFTSSDKQPYENSGQMMSDCRVKRLRVFSGGSIFAPEHPIEFYNSMFRAVHDVKGHYGWGLPEFDLPGEIGRSYGFETFVDEIKAYIRHSKQYSEDAQEALFGETVGQLCYYYRYGAFVDMQKAICQRFILPEGLLDGGRV